MSNEEIKNPEACSLLGPYRIVNGIDLMGWEGILLYEARIFYGVERMISVKIIQLHSRRSAA